jgi:cytochrome c-type biogenesis protein CcmE
MTRRTRWTQMGVVALVGIVAFGAGAFRSNLTPYVSFQQARASGDSVQVAGQLVRGSDIFDEVGLRLLFTIADEHGETMRVAYKGPKPGNFEEASQVVAIGRVKSGVLEAEKLLVKCPSKYQGTEEKSYSAKTS